jgi:hypothetical protein
VESDHEKNGEDEMRNRNSGQARRRVAIDGDDPDEDEERSDDDGETLDRPRAPDEEVGIKNGDDQPARNEVKADEESDEGEQSEV